MQRKDAFEQASRLVRQELETFEATKTKEIKAAITKLVQLNMNLELQIVDMWKAWFSFGSPVCSSLSSCRSSLRSCRRTASRERLQ